MGSLPTAGGVYFSRVPALCAVGGVMPRFDYKCPKCEQVVETTDSTAPLCRKCRVRMKRVWSAPSISWKCEGRTVINNAYKP